MIRLCKQKKHIRRAAEAAAGLLCLFAWGCSAATGAAPKTPPSASPVQDQSVSDSTIMAVKTTHGPGEGSLWNENSMLGDMFINAKARRVGDLVTIRITESANATNKATTTTDRKSSFTAGLNNFFNMEKGYPADQPFFNPFSSVKGSLESGFDGAGATARSGALTAYMTARITSVMPNGNMAIEGNREVRVNNENQIITLTGIVRPRDISSDNVVQSTYIADARIAYSGAGVVNDRQQPGWLMRIMDKIWPF